MSMGFPGVIPVIMCQGYYVFLLLCAKVLIPVGEKNLIPLHMPSFPCLLNNNICSRILKNSWGPEIVQELVVREYLLRTWGPYKMITTGFPRKFLAIAKSCIQDLLLLCGCMCDCFLNWPKRTSLKILKEKKFLKDSMVSLQVSQEHLMAS